MRFTASPEDFLKGALVPVGWHPSIIASYAEKTSKTPTDPNKLEKWEGPSTYIELQFKIVDGPSKGTVVYQNFSEKAPAFIIPLLEALGDKVDKSKAVTREVSEATLKGKTVDIHVVRGSYNNKPKNEIDGYKTFSGKVPGTA